MNPIPIFPELTLSETENIILSQALTVPSVKKFLHKMAYDLATQLIMYGEPDEGESAEKFLRRQANMRGRLEVFNTLLMIEAPADAGT